MRLGLFLPLIFTATLTAQDAPPQETEIQPEPRLHGVSRELSHQPGRTTPIRVPFSTESSLVTCVSFQEDSLKSIVAAWDQSSVSLEHNGGNLFIKLLEAKDGHIDVLGASGALYRLYVSAVQAGPYDESITIKHKPDHSTDRNRTPSSRSIRASGLDLILAMRRGQPLEGASISKGPNTFLHEGSQTRMLVRLVYLLDGLIGYVVQLQNRSESSMSLDLSRYQGEGLLLIGAREMSVEAGASTLLYLVFARQS